MIYIVSNRNVVGGRTNELLFGEDLNPEGSEIIRVAKAYFSNHSWELTLLLENGPVEPTEQIFDIVDADAKPCVIFIHGFNQSLEKNLKKCREIESYGVNVIAFSWPSNPGPNFILRKIKEYKKAQKNARRSAFALERFFDKLESFTEEKEKQGQIKTLVIHSLGNYLTQAFVQNPGFDQQTKIFKNIILHQADAHTQDHEMWTESLAVQSRVTVTINETDPVLDASDIINPDRLGNTARAFKSQKVKYYDFTDAKNTYLKHRLWAKPADENPNIRDFFKCAFHGKSITQINMDYNSSLNCYEVE